MFSKITCKSSGKSFFIKIWNTYIIYTFKKRRSERSKATDITKTLIFREFLVIKLPASKWLSSRNSFSISIWKVCSYLVLETFGYFKLLNSKSSSILTLLRKNPFQKRFKMNMYIYIYHHRLISALVHKNGSLCHVLRYPHHMYTTISTWIARLRHIEISNMLL